MKKQEILAPGTQLSSEQTSRLSFIWSADLHKIMSSVWKKHPFWSRAKIERLVVEYRRFLTLNLIHGSHVSMYSKAVDQMWHAHILHTEEYGMFCHRAFGYYLHHEPESETSRSSVSAEAFLKKYEAAFGKTDMEFYRPWWSKLAPGIFQSQPLRLCVSTGPQKNMSPQET